MIETFPYRSVQGDTLDLICHRHYGKTAGVLEQVMEINPHFAELGPVIAENTLVTLPKIVAQERNETASVQLWS